VWEGAASRTSVASFDSWHLALSVASGRHNRGIPSLCDACSGKLVCACCVRGGRFSTWRRGMWRSVARQSHVVW